MCCDDTPPSAFSEETRKARKEHQCCECLDPILRGEHYSYSSGIWDREPGSFRRCLSCAAWAAALHKALRGSTSCICVVFGQLWEAVAEWAEDQEDRAREESHRREPMSVWQ